VADLLCGEEGFEDVGENGSVHSGAVVADRHADIGAGSGTLVDEIVGGYRDIRGRDREATLARHGIATVVRQIEQRVLQLCCVDHRRPDLSLQVHPDVDGLTHREADERHHPGDQLIDVDLARFQRLGSREGQ